jgi:hypothetical protein
MVLKGKGSRQKREGRRIHQARRRNGETYCSVFLVAKVGIKQVIQLEADDGRWEGDGRPSEHYPGKAFDSLDHRPPSVDGGGSG